ncbi:MAG: hypothetical protein AAF211_01475, partial [Myxococcota bacterium]
MVKYALYATAVLLLVAAGGLGWDYLTFLEERDLAAKVQGAATTAELRTQLDDVLTRIGAEADKLAEQLGNGDHSPEEVLRIVREGSLAVPELQGVTACYEPYAFDPERRLYCPYYDKVTQTWIYVEDSYDYTVEGEAGTAWYTKVRQDGARWVEPYYARAAGGWYVDYGAPFTYRSGPRKGEVRGTITMSFEVRGFKELVHGMALGRTGYGMITSSGGMFLAHPLDANVGTKGLKDLIPTVPEELRAGFEAMLGGETGVLAYDDDEQNDEGL